MSITQTILINNRSNQNYRLSVPFFNFVHPFIIIQRTQFSIPIPYNVNAQTLCLLTNQGGGQVFKFTMNVNGEIIQADKGLTIMTVSNGLSGDFYGQIPVQVDEQSNNGLIINRG